MNIALNTWLGGIPAWRNDATERLRTEMRAALTAALPFLPVQGAVKKLEWGEMRHTDDYSFAQDAETPIGRYIATDTGWFLQGQSGWESEDNIEAAKAAAQADYSARILSALEPSAAREQALEEAAHNLINELSGDTGELIDRMAAAIRDWGSHYDDGPWETLPEDRKAGWRGDAERALAVVKEYLTTRALSSPDHADAGKVEGDGCKSEREKYLEEVLRPFSEIAGELFAANFNNDDVVFTLNRKTANGSKLSYQMTAKAFFEARFALPSAPSEGAE
ncbi:hypothetical protein [Ochrobactrum sp. J50]|uniref:hypothetical protein n=1 Tax=Ochrobactrum sp. J50 TaxID=936132 RepID=UPI0011A406EE|nr:hypothetical protein [Ochrobactrum sp. J50]